MAINWAKNIDRLNIKGGNEPKGEDWFTAKEFIDNSNYGSCKCRQQLKDAVESGEMEVHAGSHWNKVQKQLTRLTWYRFVNRK